MATRLAPFAGGFTFAGAAAAAVGGHPPTIMSGPYNVIIDLSTQETQLGEEGGPWRYTAASSVLGPGGLEVFSDTTRGIFNGLFAGTYTFTGQRYNVGTTTGLGPIVSAVVVIPQPDAPDPSVEKRIIILDDYNARGQVKYLLWAEVPLALQAEFAHPGAVSEWELATGAEQAAIAAGEVAELRGYLTRGVLSHGEVRTELEARWARFSAAVQDTEAASEENTFWLGDRWMRL